MTSLSVALTKRRTARDAMACRTRTPTLMIRSCRSFGVDQAFKASSPRFRRFARPSMCRSRLLSLPWSSSSSGSRGSRFSLRRSNEGRDTTHDEINDDEETKELEESPPTLKSWDGGVGDADSFAWPTEDREQDDKKGLLQGKKWFGNVVFGASIGVAALVALISYKYYKGFNAGRRAHGGTATITVAPMSSERGREEHHGGNTQSVDSLPRPPFSSQQGETAVGDKDQLSKAVNLDSFPKSAQEEGAEIAPRSEEDAGKLQPETDIDRASLIDERPVEGSETERRGEHEDTARRLHKEEHEGDAQILGYDTMNKEKNVKLPLRTPQGEAALSRIRELQARRRKMYDQQVRRDEGSQERVDDNSHGKKQGRKDGGTAGPESKREDSAGKESREAPSQTSRKTDDSLSDSKAAMTHYAKHVATRSPVEEYEEIFRQSYMDDDIRKWDADEIQKAAAQLEATANEATGLNNGDVTVRVHEDTPNDMDISSISSRALAAQRLATSTAISAQRAMHAAGMAADAAESAMRDAHAAAVAAARCRSSFEAVSEDSMEDVLREIKEANERAASAAGSSAAHAARAVMQQHESSKHSKAAVEAGDLSLPHTVQEKVSYALKNTRRALDGAFHTVTSLGTQAGRAAGRAMGNVKESWEGVVHKSSSSSSPLTVSSSETGDATDRAPLEASKTTDSTDGKREKKKSEKKTSKKRSVK